MTRDVANGSIVAATEAVLLHAARPREVCVSCPEAGKEARRDGFERQEPGPKGSATRSGIGDRHRTVLSPFGLQ